MARYIQDIVLNKPDDFVNFIMNDFIQKHGFKLADWKGQPAYRAGDIMFEGYKYLIWSYQNGIFHLEAWLRGTFGGEWDLEGFVGCAQKGPYKNLLNQLLATLGQPLPQNTAPAPGASANGSFDQNGASPVPNPTPAMVPVQTTDNHTAATLSLVFGILSIVCCWSYLLCILFAVLGFSQSRMGQGSSKAGMAKAGKICSIVGVSLMAAYYVIYIGLSVFLAILS
ncbi:MAG: hypothetical protein NC399_06225 [Muribaculum sp.]|nr:hypothetical protein [Muribaculum sp.]